MPSHNISIPILPAIAALALSMTSAFSCIHAQQVDTGISKQSRGVVHAYLLQVKPQQGDELKLNLRQVIEVTSARVDGNGMSSRIAGEKPTTPDVGPRKDAVPLRVTMMDFHARSKVDGLYKGGTMVTTHTDSLVVRSGEVGQTMVEQNVLPKGGFIPVRILVESNGAMTLLESDSEFQSVGTTLSGIPAMLPADPISPGATWEHLITVPTLPNSKWDVNGYILASFRFDSLSSNSREAHISVRGTFNNDGPVHELVPGTQMVTGASLAGNLRLDRRRSWITEAKIIMEVKSEVRAPLDGGAPIHLGLRITQHLTVR